MEHAFGSGEPFTVGIEEELFLVDPHTRELAQVAAEVLAAMRVPDGTADHEAYAAEIELRSLPSRTTADAVAALARGRATARDAGGTLLGAGLHPDAQPGDAQLVDTERYRRVLGSMRGLIQRTPECALHVHVGMPDPETAVRAFNGLRAHLPLLQGLAASSAFWFGRDSGLASARAAMVSPYPGRGVPRALRDFDDYTDALDATAAGGGPDDYTLIWWDVRLHPRLGTVELRELDAQSRLEDVAAIAALARALARQAAETSAQPAPREAIEWSAFHAARDGLAARIACDGRLVRLPEAARSTLERVAGHAREAGDGEALGGVERILRDGCGADRQRQAHARGGMPALLDALVRETAA